MMYNLIGKFSVQDYQLNGTFYNHFLYGFPKFLIDCDFFFITFRMYESTKINEKVLLKILIYFETIQFFQKFFFFFFLCSFCSAYMQFSNFISFTAKVSLLLK